MNSFEQWTTERWKSTYGDRATGGFSWTGRTRLLADIDQATAAMLRVRPGRVGAGNAVLLDNAFWSRLELSGGPRSFVGRFGSSSTVLIEIDPGRRMFALQGRLGWRIVTQLEPDGSATAVVRHIRHLARGQRLLVPLIQRSPWGLYADARRLAQASRTS